MSHKVIGILQPVYLPWLGFFEQMAYVDHFVCYDDVQYTQRDWRNRNRILSSKGPIWLTVPIVRQPLNTTIQDTKIDNGRKWARKHLRSIEQNYQNTPHFQPLFNELRQCLSKNWFSLLSLDMELISIIAKLLNIDTETSFASAIPKNLYDRNHFKPDNGNEKLWRRNMRLIELCQYHKAQSLYIGAKSKEYIDLKMFADHGLSVIFQKYEHPQYVQSSFGFQSHMSVIDLIMNEGPRAREILLSSPLPRDIHPSILFNN